MHRNSQNCQNGSLENADNFLLPQGAKNLAGDTFDVLFVGTNRGKVCNHNLIGFLVCLRLLFFKNIFTIGGHNLIEFLVGLFLFFQTFYLQ